jgi:hypothetical protein
MKKLFSLMLGLGALAFTACSDDENGGPSGNAVGFPNPAINLTSEVTTVTLNFMNPAKADGTVTLSLAESNVEYGVDYTTMPAASVNTLVVPFSQGDETTSFTFTRLVSAIEGEAKNVVVTIASVTNNMTIIPTAKAVQLNFDESPIQNATAFPAIGGANIPNQVYFDFSSGNGTGVSRTGWDLAFYSGDGFQVAINASIKMAAKNTGLTDITLPVAVDADVAVGEGGGAGIVAGNPDYVDYPDGDITKTAINTVSSNDADNKVYLVNLGHEIATSSPGAGSVNPYGASRGWMKIRVLRQGENYLLQYADIDSADYQEIAISKTAGYNFTFFSFDNGVVQAEPAKNQWDIVFTPFVNLVNFGTGMVSYAYQDYIVTNRNANVRAYEQLNAAGISYANFSLADIDNSKFNQEAAIDQRAIGANWRNGGGPSSAPSVRDDRFYIVKDPAENIYKVRFISLTNGAGERGNPSFEYHLLQ